jgi:hypothetical protein
MNPHFLRRIAKNYINWCDKMGAPAAKDRLASFTDTETLVKLKPVIVEELKKRGIKK